MKKLLATFALSCAAIVAQAETPAHAPVAVEGAWARAVLQGQSSSAAYMKLTASEPLTLVGASSPAAGVVQLHEMHMDGNVMRMREVKGLELKPGQSVELKPGSYHFMLMDLKAQFKPDTQVPMTLRFRDAKGGELGLALSLPVSIAPPMAMQMPMKH